MFFWLVEQATGRLPCGLACARFELLARAGHVPYLSNPGPFNDVVKPFLGHVDRAAAARRAGP